MNKKILALVTICALSLSAACEAGFLSAFDKVGEKIGLGPSKKRIGYKIKPGTIMTLRNKHTYQILDQGGGYRKAVLYAERMGGHLAVIDNWEENELLYDFMIRQGFKAAYFGLVDKDFTNEWTLPDGSMPNFINWQAKQPNRDNNNNRYAMLYSLYTKGQWKAGSFSKLDPQKGGTAFIIEWDRDLTPKQNTSATKNSTATTNSRSKTYYPVVEADEDVISSD